MDSFLKKFFPEVLAKEKADKSTNQYCRFDSQLLTSFTSSLYLAALIASFFASSVTRAFGRKWSMLGGGLTFLVGSALNGAAVNVLMLILGRILLGIGVGFANQVGLHRSRFLLNSRKITSIYNCSSFSFLLQNSMHIYLLLFSRNICWWESNETF